jgi:hypothetical protein
MSAYIVQDKTINQVTSWMRHDDHLSGPYNTKRLAEIGVQADADNSLWDNLGRAMFALNVKAVDARYGEGEAAQFRALDFRPSWEINNAVQAYKSLSCWQYQCSEGDVPETDLFRYMETVLAHIANMIIATLPAYQKATWG